MESHSPRAVLLVQPKGPTNCILGRSAYVIILNPSNVLTHTFLVQIESRHIQQCTLKVSPVQINYAPDGKSLLYVSSGNQLFFMSYGKDSDDSTASAQWSPMDRSPVTHHFTFPFPA